ncbi:MAG: hypothetical protein RQ741_04545 [Wenzhouxiangellaceae bacterium]|nr:hypothetical protein [Wenzhouxiangellaceae bacterium]
MNLEFTRLSGPDAGSFCQAQLTLDMKKLDPGILYPAAWCAPDGRVLFTLLVAPGPDQVWIVAPAPMMAALLKRIDLFRIGRKLKYDPALPVKLVRDDKLRDRRHPESNAFALAYDRQRGMSLATDLPQADQVAVCRWLLEDARAGMPWILPPTTQMFLPQMLGLEKLGGLSYSKGCYPGQEVVARVHYRGRVKKRIARFRLSPAIEAGPGTVLESAGTTGTALYAVSGDRDRNSTVGLAVVPVDWPEDAEIFAAESHGMLLNDDFTVLISGEMNE